MTDYIYLATTGCYLWPSGQINHLGLWESIGSYRPHPSSPFELLLHRKAATYFSISHRVEAELTWTLKWGCAVTVVINTAAHSVGFQTINFLIEIIAVIDFLIACYHTTTTTILRLFFPGPPRWAGARRELLDFMVQRKINRQTHRPSGWVPLHLDKPVPTSTIPPIFYRPDALPAAQPTVSKHWRQLAQSRVNRILMHIVKYTDSVP